MLDVVEVEDDILEEENDEEDEKDPSSLFVEVAINCEAEEESCLTAVLPKISEENTWKKNSKYVFMYSKFSIISTVRLAVWSSHFWIVQYT